MDTFSSLGYLPRDLLTEILMRLPGKPLLQFKSVSKEWLDIISSPSFITKHLNHNDNLTRLVLYWNGIPVGRNDEMSCSYSYFPDETTQERHEVPDNLLMWGKIKFLRGPCNGIFCIYIEKNRFALWNPTTRRLRPIYCLSSYKFDEMGFGVDPLTGDFKIVLIESVNRISPCFAVYTSSTHSWKYLEQETLFDSEGTINTRTSGSNTFMNGFYYWMKHNKFGYSDSSSSILAFDMHNEIFQEKKMPPEIIDLRWNGFLHLFKDSLAVVTSFDDYSQPGGGCLEIWLMDGKKWHWIKFLTVVLPYDDFSVYGFWGENKIILSVASTYLHGMVMYDLHSQSIRVLETEKMVHDVLPIYYKESLLSVKDEHGTIQDCDTRSAEGLEFLGYKRPTTYFGIKYHGDIADVVMGDYSDDDSDVLSDWGDPNEPEHSDEDSDSVGNLHSEEEDIMEEEEEEVVVEEEEEGKEKEEEEEEEEEDYITEEEDIMEEEEEDYFFDV